MGSEVVEFLFFSIFNVLVCPGQSEVGDLGSNQFWMQKSRIWRGLSSIQIVELISAATREPDPLIWGLGSVVGLAHVDENLLWRM